MPILLCVAYAIPTSNCWLAHRGLVMTVISNVYDALSGIIERRLIATVLAGARRSAELRTAWSMGPVSESSIMFC